MRFLFGLLVLELSTIAVSSSVNYCGAKMCGHTDDHTFCQFPPGPSPSCQGYMEARLSANEKSRIIARLNRRRSECAMGKLKHLPPAANMLTLRWVEELSREAKRWADQCIAPASPDLRDDCRDLYSTSVGQCISSVVGEAPGLRVESLIDVWYMQNIYYKGNVSFYSSSEKPFYGDFAQMIWARTYLVGCARSRFMTPWKGRLRSVERLVCNFAPRGPTLNKPLWVQGSPASSCPVRSSRDPNLSALCSFQYDSNEKHDVENTMSLEEHALLDAVLKVERNESLRYIGCLDELYLTKLAINDFITEPIFNFMSKQNRSAIIKVFNKQDSNNETDKNDRDNQEAEAINIPKRKTNLIGRPKSYNIEELSDPNSETLNQFEETTEEKVQINNYLYDDYDFKEQRDESSNLLNDATALSDLPDDNDNQNTERNEIGNVTEIEMSSSTDGKININTAKEEAKETPVTPRIEDYLSDPETLQQLQEALDRMEQTVSSTDGISGKVRRELRGFPENQFESNPTLPVPKLTNQLNEVQDKPQENGAVMKMMLKYLPYLKSYQSNILGSSNEASKLNKLSLLPMFSFIILFV